MTKTTTQLLDGRFTVWVYRLFGELSYSGSASTHTNSKAGSAERAALRATLEAEAKAKLDRSLAEAVEAGLLTQSQVDSAE